MALKRDSYYCGASIDCSMSNEGGESVLLRKHS